MGVMLTSFMLILTVNLLLCRWVFMPSEFQSLNYSKVDLGL